jgi:F-type H+-transporting ATPase subunit alpha
VLKQPQYEPVPVAAQISALLTVTSGLFDEMPLADIIKGEHLVRQAVTDELWEVCQHIQAGQSLKKEERHALLRVAQAALRTLPQGSDGNP